MKDKLGAPIFVALILAGNLAYLTSVIYGIGKGEWLLTIIINILLAPIGIIHGVCIWFGSAWF